MTAHDLASLKGSKPAEGQLSKSFLLVLANSLSFQGKSIKENQSGLPIGSLDLGSKPRLKARLQRDTVWTKAVPGTFARHPWGSAKDLSLSMESPR